MTADSRQRPPRRTLVLALGQRGLAIAHAFQRRLAEREQPYPFLATAAIVASIDCAADTIEDQTGGEVCVIPIEFAHSDMADALASQESLRQAVLRTGPHIVAALVEQLLGISRVRPAQSAWSTPLKLDPEVDVVLAAALDDPLASACLLEVAYLVRHLARQRLNAAAQVTGLLLLPEIESAEVPQLDIGYRPGGMARCYAGLRELDRVMAPHDGFVTTWGDGLTVEGWGPPFDHGCYLLGALNAQSLTLGSVGTRNEFAAEIVLQLAATGLAGLCDGPASAASSWRLGERAQSYAGVGLAAWVYPAEQLIEHVSQRMAVELLDAWLTPGGGLGGCAQTGPSGGDAGESVPWEEQATAFWQSNGATLDALSDQALPATDLDPSALWRPLERRLTLATARSLRHTLDEQMADRLEGLAAQRPAQDQRAAEIGRRLGTRLAQAIARTLDKPEAGRLPEAAALAAAAKRWLEQEQASNDAAGETRWHALAQIERELEETGRQLDVCIAAGRFPEPTWRSMAATLVRPRRLWQLAQLLPELQRLAAAYAALLLRQTSVVLEVLKHDLVTAAYDAAVEAAGRQRARLSGLNQSAVAAAERLQPVPPAPCGTLGFGLEQSVLTQETAGALYRQVRGALPDLLADVAASRDRLSGWPVGDPDGEDMAGVYVAFARSRCAGPLRALTIDRLLVEAVPDPRVRLEALAGLAESAGPFLAWDETRLHSLEQGVLYSCAVLGLGEGVGSLALADTGEVLFAQVAQTGDHHRVTALSAVQGLTLAALAGMDEYEDGGTDDASQ